MIAEIKKSVAKGEILARSSKSYAHRALICASLCKGESEIKNISTSEDIEATIKCLEKLGATFKFDGTTVTVTGALKDKKENTLSLFANESGSTLRFLIPVALLFSKEVEFLGSKRLLERPQSVYEELFPTKNCSIENLSDKILVKGTLSGGEYKIRGDVSSQFLTGLLFTLPLLNEDSKIILTTPLQSKPYIDLTLEILNEFGVEVTVNDYKEFFIKGNQCYKEANVFCEGDWSNSAFLEAFNLIGGSVKVNGLNENSTQGDKIYRRYFELLKNGSPVLDITDCPDLAPILMALASLLNGVTLKGTSRLKIKESDRGEVMKQELQKFSSDVTVLEDEIIIKKKELFPPSEMLYAHNDHRIAMSLSVMCSVLGGKIDNAECVNKSYPMFFEDIKKLGINFDLI